MMTSKEGGFLQGDAFDLSLEDTTIKASTQIHLSYLLLFTLICQYSVFRITLRHFSSLITKTHEYVAHKTHKYCKTSNIIRTFLP